MNLLLLITGNKDLIISANSLRDVEIIKIDEKQLSNFKYVNSLVNKSDYSSIYFGSLDNNFQRFQYFMKTFILLSKAKNGSIIDELGTSNTFSFFKYLSIETPKFALELLLSGIIAVYFHIKLPVIKWMLKKS